MRKTNLTTHNCSLESSQGSLIYWSEPTLKVMKLSFRCSSDSCQDPAVELSPNIRLQVGGRAAKFCEDVTHMALKHEPLRQCCTAFASPDHMTRCKQIADGISMQCDDIAVSVSSDCQPQLEMVLIVSSRSRHMLCRTIDAMYGQVTMRARSQCKNHESAAQAAVDASIECSIGRQVKGHLRRYASMRRQSETRPGINNDMAIDSTCGARAASRVVSSKHLWLHGQYDFE
jgi:hypothetical protein